MNSLGALTVWSHVTGGRFFCYIQSFCHENLEGSVFLCTFAAVNS